MRVPSLRASMVRWCVILSGAVGMALVVVFVIASWHGIATKPSKLDLDSLLLDEDLSANEPAVRGRPPVSVESKDLALLRQEADRVCSELAAFRGEDVDSLRLQAESRYRLGDLPQAIVLWKKCLRLSPDRADVYTSMGRACFERGHSEKAELLLRHALDLDATSLPTVLLLANALFSQGKMRETAELLQVVTSDLPGAVPALVLRGQALLQLQDYGAAKRCFESAVGLEPNSPNAVYGMVMACAQLGEQEQSAAYRRKFQELDRQALALRRDQHASRDEGNSMRAKLAVTYQAAAEMYAAGGDSSRAESHWRRGAELDPNSLACRNSRLVLYQQTGRTREAMEIARQLRAIQPDSVVWLVTLALLHGSLHEFAQAEDVLRESLQRSKPQTVELLGRAVEREPKSESFYVLSLACCLAGDKQASTRAIQKALAAEPQNASYQELYARIRQLQ